MRRMLGLTTVLVIGLVAAPAMADLVGDEIVVGGPVALDNANATTALGTLTPFAGEYRFAQQPNLNITNPDNTGVTTPPEDRLFKHDYTFTVPNIGNVGGQANANDLPNNLQFMGQPLVDIVQFTIGLFTDGGPGSGGTLVDPPGLDEVLNPGTRVELRFADLAPGNYTLRVAGILNGFDVHGDWHGEYQGNVSITPLPGALVMFLSAILGLGWMAWRRRPNLQRA